MKSARKKSPLRIILSAVDSEEKALEIATALVQQKIVACVNLIPAARSIYLWQGKLCDSQETLLVIKTTLPFKKIEAALRKIHPYEVPEIVGWEAKDVSADYWIWATGASAATKDFRK